MKNLLIAVFSCVSLFAHEIKECEYVLPFEAKMFSKEGEETKSEHKIGALVQFRTGEVVIATTDASKGLSFDNPFYIVRDEEFDEEIFFNRELDTEPFAEGEQVATVVGDKILRRVVTVEQDRIVFDDGFEILRLTDVTFPHNTEFNIEDTKFSLVLYSMYPLVLLGKIESDEVQGGIGIDCNYGFNVDVEICTKEEQGSLHFRSMDGLKTAIGLGEYREGELYCFYPIRPSYVYNELLKAVEDHVGEAELYLIYRAE